MLGFEVSPIVQYVVAFAIIAILLALFAIVLKRIGGNRFAMSGGERGRGRQPRLGIVDVYDLDRQRQLVLLRRDNVEHLVMLGGANDFVVESNIVRMPASRAMTPQPQMQPGQAPHGAPPVAGPDSGHDRATTPEIGDALQPLAPPPAPLQPFPTQPPAPPQEYPEQATMPVAPVSSPPRAAAQPPAPAPGGPSAPSAPADGDRPVSAGAQPGAPASPRPDELRSAPRPQEAPQPPKRGLFGFSRPGSKSDEPAGDIQAREIPAGKAVVGREAPPTPAMPPFPPRSRATPVAPPTPAPYSPRRPIEAAQPTPHAAAGLAESGLAAAAIAGGGVAAAVAARSGSGEGKAAASTPSRDPLKESSEGLSGSRETARATPDLQQALLSDMERELEAAFQRQASAQPAPETSAQPVLPTPPKAPAFPVRMAPEVPEPVISGSMESAMPAEEAPATADAAGAVHPHVPQPGMTPPPSTGPAYFAPVVDEAIPPQEELQVAHRDPSPPDPLAGASDTHPAPTMSADDASSDAALMEESFGDVIAPEEVARVEPAADEKRPEEATSQEPAGEEPARQEPARQEPVLENTFPEGLISEAPVSEKLASEESAADEPNMDVLPVKEGPIEPLSAEPHSRDGAISEDALQDSSTPDETAEQPAEQAVEEPSEKPDQGSDEPRSKVDPFSVDEIEAEFARLLGRSVDKDPKSS